MRRRRGATLAEVVISLGLFSVFLMLATNLYTRSFAYIHGQERPARIREQAQLIMNRLSRAIRTCDELHEPDVFNLILAKQASRHLVLTVRTPEGDRTVGYRLTAERTLEEIVYSNDYQSYDPATHVREQEPRTVCSEVEEFTLQVEDPTRPWLCTLTLVVRAPSIPTDDPTKGLYGLRTRVNFRNEQ